MDTGVLDAEQDIQLTYNPRWQIAILEYSYSLSSSAGTAVSPTPPILNGPFVIIVPLRK